LTACIRKTNIGRLKWPRHEECKDYTNEGSISWAAIWYPGYHRIGYPGNFYYPILTGYPKYIFHGCKFRWLRNSVGWDNEKCTTFAPTIF